MERGTELDPRLGAFVLPGVVVDDDRLYLRALLERRDGERERFDRSGHESWVNSLHLDEVVDDGADQWGALCVAQGLLLAEQVHQSIPQQRDSVVVDYVISVDFGEARGTYPSSSFRFYRHRPDEPPMLAEISTFAQPLLRIRRSR
ncbi:hypothetical protein [Cellulomonas cellasea]|uniref:Uncharacterized protein n=2 Tax=Cellulomonas cellasea TaxID=43670 RepID=A0A0A0B4B9_9CELL|nr:hypothetical protein [Cellulomonas cellasea]KGM01705.1 hypothetical protein Q760_17840 [Cellulomonas cellasea DSM 20118]GEA86989.1 hypothetical protein CCE01nite_09380 [Cellulomonas cellasea]